MALALSVRNFRSLKQVDWSPSGLNVLVGANGAGKTTLLTVFELLRSAYLRNVSSAIEYEGGTWGLRNFTAPQGEPISFSVTVDDVRWSLELPFSFSMTDGGFRERVEVAGQMILEREPTWDYYVYRGVRTPANGGIALRKVVETDSDVSLRLLDHAIRHFRVYKDYRLWQLRLHGSRSGSDLFLHPSGDNAFSVLRNWRDKRNLRGAYDFVVEGLRSAFPDLIDDIGFDLAGQTITLTLYTKDAAEPVPIFFAPDGVIVALLHLCAVGGAEPGSVVAIDEMENALHPFAIRSLARAFREAAESRNLVIPVATHSPVLIDEFQDDPSRVFIIRRNAPSQPVPLAEERNPEWLRLFALGKLYADLEYGAPLNDSATK